MLSVHSQEFAALAIVHADDLGFGQQPFPDSDLPEHGSVSCRQLLMQGLHTNPFDREILHQQDLPQLLSQNGMSASVIGSPSSTGSGFAATRTTVFGRWLDSAACRFLTAAITFSDFDGSGALTLVSSSSGS